MIQSVVLTRVHKADKDKQGKQYGFSRWGKFIQSTRIAIKIEGSEEWYSDFMQTGDVRDAWEAGMRVHVVLYEKKGFQNFRQPREMDYLESRVEKIEAHLGLGKVSDTLTAPEEVEPNDLPF